MNGSAYSFLPDLAAAASIPVLGVGLTIGILVQLVVRRETMILRRIFLATGFVLGFLALFWLRRTGQVRLWQQPSVRRLPPAVRECAAYAT